MFSGYGPTADVTAQAVVEPTSRVPLITAVRNFISDLRIIWFGHGIMKILPQLPFHHSFESSCARQFNSVNSALISAQRQVLNHPPTCH